MKLNLIESGNLINYLNRIDKKCSLCGERQFEIADKIFTLTEFQTEPFALANYPVIPLSCKNCGNTYFLNALKWSKRI